MHVLALTTDLMGAAASTGLASAVQEGSPTDLQDALATLSAEDKSKLASALAADKAAKETEAAAVVQGALQGAQAMDPKDEAAAIIQGAMRGAMK